MALPLGAAAQQIPIVCSTPAPIGNSTLLNPAVAYDEPHNRHSVIFEQAVTGGGMKLVSLTKGPDGRWGTADDKTSDLMRRAGRPGQVDSKARLAHDSVLFRRILTERTRTGQVGRKIAQLIRVGPGRDGYYGTNDDSPPQLVKTISRRRFNNPEDLRYGINDDLVAWMYRAAAPNGIDQGWFIGGCDLKVLRFGAGACNNRSNFEAYIGAQPSFLAGASEVEILPLRFIPGANSPMTAMVIARNGTSTETRAVRLPEGTFFDPLLGQKDIIVSLASNPILVQNRTNGVYELANPANGWGITPLNVMTIPPVAPATSRIIVTGVGIRPLAYENNFPYTFKFQDTIFVTVYILGIPTQVPVPVTRFGYWHITPGEPIQPAITATIRDGDPLPYRVTVGGDTIIYEYPQPIGMRAQRCYTDYPEIP